MTIGLDTIIDGVDGRFKRAGDVTIEELIEFKRLAFEAQLLANSYDTMIRCSEQIIVVHVCQFIRKALN